MIPLHLQAESVLGAEQSSVTSAAQAKRNQTFLKEVGPQLASPSGPPRCFLRRQGPGEHGQRAASYYPSASLRPWRDDAASSRRRHERSFERRNRQSLARRVAVCVEVVLAVVVVVVQRRRRIEGADE